MKYFLGIDQGGTKSQVAICAEDGSFIGAATGEASISYLDDPGNKTTVMIRRIAEKILTDAGLSWDCLSAVCGGISGIDWPHEVPIHEDRLRSVLKLDNIIAVNDCIIAMRAGSAAPNRCIVCAGTAINIAAQDYVYGWFISYRLHGGAALGCQVRDVVIDAEVGVRPPTMLTDALLSCFGCTSVEEFLVGTTTNRIAFTPQSVVPGLLNAFLAGDEAAREIIDEFIKGLASYLENAVTRFFPPLSAEDEECKAELVYSGGVFKGNGRLITDALTNILSKKFPRLRFVNARLEPVCGALLMQLEKYYAGNIPCSIIETFENGCKQHKLIR